ncbi:hypothetical protein PPYR_05325 [Photinus pyralis]|uniref:Histone-lysine N-methyltransferase trithorax n=1 Tax=Photinus pyralis TaxID=7054 RepID=A0A1Y1KZS5_PHOPY|nr:histone-lysine N-methyltransferase trithorax [Photinus pyralis]KAB0800971.1 hypothetical protein PPYR_05325 [Photinus pyralis]
MARSKFPGKPSKPVNRKRINVLNSSEETVSNLNNTETKQENCDPAAKVDTSISYAAVRLPHRQAVRKRVCKTLIARRNSLSKRRLVNSTVGTSSQKLITIINERSVRTKAESRSENELSCRKLIKTKQSRLESSNLVGKFILPSRSVHSSRVIKPNKRFINVEAVNSIQLRTFKKRVINKKSASTNGTACKVNCSDSECKDVAVHENVDLSRSPCSSRRVVLRQARLQLHTQTPTGPEGPFSMSSSNISPPGTVTCGVCGAVRFYRFVKQARKFNIYSCESCRKFISKMIKCQVSNKKLPDIQCLKGQGNCHVPPIVRSQHWKFRCAYKARCNACWLKMCLRSFQIPPVLKNNLISLLPEHMRESDTLFNTSLFSFHTSANPSSVKSPKPEPELHVRRRPLRKRVGKIKEKLNLVNSEIKRQKIDFKGPRVKHVCRSASIVLGQPLAVFADCEKKPDDVKVNECGDDKALGTLNGTKENSVPVENKKSESRPPEIDAPKVEHEIQKREKVGKHSLFNTTLHSKPSAQPTEVDNNICIDFWENYDPEEVCQNGFGLIASLAFPMLAVCYLCGSAGQESLLYCCLCCEPYHPFCLEQPPQNINNDGECYNWLCPRCTMCSACGEADKQKINCQKCQRPYHPECFNNKWRTEDRPTVCASCMRCKSCGINNITKFIGNTPLCLICFRLRKKGNFCPLCQKCYDDNDYNTKMMECAKCNMWVHAKCESLSDEQYQILSLLPESVEFLCSICEPLPYWRKAVDSELRTCFNNVLKLLSKNRVARNMLKWSPTYFSSPNAKAATAVRRLQFSDESEVSNESSAEDNPEQEQLGNSKNTRKKYQLRELRVAVKPCTINTDDLFEEEKINVKTPSTPSLSKVKYKLNSKEYFSLKDFDHTMVETFESAKSTELLNIYRSILKQVFPWYNPSENDSPNNNTSFCNTFSETNEISTTYDGYKHKMVNNIESDNRICVLCKGLGDGSSYREARLLYCGYNEWVHANCALWSSEVYEEIDGSLQNVHSAISRSRHIRCTYCKLKGASIGCCAKSCYETYHFSCAHLSECNFMQDKSIYCPSHGDINNSAVISAPVDFGIRRSIYVELDKKKKRYAEPKKIHFMVGSLCVTDLGTILPAVSDNTESLIPISFVCRRLFWSTTEPWRLIPYVITTSVLRSQNTHISKDRNFTVDHSLPKLVLDKKLKEISTWQKDLETITSGCADFEEDEEPQNENAADILSPELTDAILDELPHEFLDGISMQDIFPKLMSNEELLGMDFKVPDVGNSELCKSDLNDSSKKSSFFDDSKETSNASSKDPKSEALQHINRMSKVRNQQRSCSVTVSCKVDNTTAATKPIKVSPDKSLYLQLLQVDGACDSGSDTESITYDNVNWVVDVGDEPVKCERCQCTYRTSASYTRHLATCEEISTSESDSELTHEQEQSEVADSIPSTSTEVTEGETAEPYIVSSYESYSEITTQNESSTFVSTESASELVTVPQASEIFFSNLQPTIEQKSLPALFASQNASNQTSAIAISQPSGVSLCEPSQMTLSINQSLPISHISSNPSGDFCINQPPSLYIGHPNCNSLVNNGNTISFVTSGALPINHGAISVAQPNGLINPSGSIHLNQPVEIQPQQLTIQPVPIAQEVTPVLNLNSKVISPNVVTQTVAVPQNQFLKPMFKPTILTQRPIRIRGRPRPLAAKRTRQVGPRTLFIPPGATSTPSVVVQQLPSANVISNFIDTFQQPASQNLQYITTIAPQITTALQTQTPLVHLQSEGTLVNLVPGVQSTVLLSQPRVINDQILVDNNGALVWAPQPVQPIFYGFETIVQNTVLQSQQFLPSTVPGVLTTNSSYSSTTQVFQASKLEPVLDVASGNIVLLNSNSVVNQQPLQVSQSVQSQVPTTPLVISERKSAAPWIVESRDSAEAPPKVATKIVTTIPKCDTTTTAYNTGTTTTSSNASASSINLPVAPFVPEPGIPTNIVPPTPKPVTTTTSTTTTQARPMSRVLPMPTNNLKQIKVMTKPAEKLTYQKPKLAEVETGNSITKAHTINTLHDVIIKSISETPVTNKPEANIIPKDETASLKLIFQKQSEGGLYKISNNYTPKNVQIAPLKPIKPKSCVTQPFIGVDEENVSEKMGRQVKPEKQESAIVYKVEAQDGFNCSSTSITELWNKVFQAVQAARLANNMAPLPSGSINMKGGFHVLGLNTNGLKYLIEQLPDAGKCSKYKPIFHTLSFQNEFDDDSTIQHTYGAARCLPYQRTHEPSDLFGWLASKHRKPHLQNVIDFEQYTRRGSITNLPMAMRFRHLKLTSRQSVGVFRSQIHKRGLFCQRDIESGEMVIEYAGEVIRSVLADKRERQYTVIGMGCYMFRIDENFVVDATMKGNAARFINHSCDPNCYSKVVEILGHKHIIIFALRKIICGEELTYDYKFPFEEDKIPCTCGSRRCRKFLN